MKSPAEIVEELYKKDHFSQWLGIEILKIEAGFCLLKINTREEMFNGHGIIHGGISYSISDSALAFAANSHGIKAVSIETSIAHIAPIHLNDTLFVECKEVNCGKTIARYESIVTNQNQKLVAKFSGTVYRSGEHW